MITSLRSSRNRSGRDTDTKKIAPGATAIASRRSREGGLTASWYLTARIYRLTGIGDLRSRQSMASSMIRS